MNLAEQIVEEVKKAIVGKDIIVKKVLMVMLAKGHILLEDIPGVGKTTLAMAFAKTLALETKRVQFTPDVMPSDVVGFRMMDKESGELRFIPGVAFCNLFLADEINRTSSKTQSALLEVMEEGQISVDGFTQVVDRPFMVIATQNPKGSAGTQLLPESQLDRFMIRMSMGYPSVKDEVEMMKRKSNQNPLDNIKAIASGEDILEMISQVEQTHVADDIYLYIAQLVDETRHHPAIKQGASPRSSLALCAMAKSCAYLSGRDYVVPQDVQVIFKDTIAHRVHLHTDANNLTANALLDDILQQVQAPSLHR